MSVNRGGRISYENYLEELKSRKLTVGSENYDPDAVWRTLSTFATPARLGRIENVALNRTHKFIPILSDIYDRGNISAVLRSAEGMGFGEIHLIQRGDRFRVANRVTRGADEWLDIFTWGDPSVVSLLKTRGYKVLSTGFENAMSIHEVDFTQPTAFVFGNEKEGVKPDIAELCDGCVYIPMGGFSQSFNISVAAALSMFTARQEINSGDEEHLKFYRGKLLLKSLTNAEQLLGALNV